ncbi:MAG: MFS transporter [Chlamydiota bacterium]
MFYKFALEVSPSVMTTTLMSAFNMNGAQLGNLAACYFYAYLIMQLPAGLLIDKFGPRKVTTAAIALCAVGSFVFAKSNGIATACIGRFLTGCGAAFAAVNCLKLIANWFPMSKFAFMAGLMMTVGMLGAVGGQAPLSAFIESMDWRHAMETIGIGGFVLAALFWFVVRDKAPDHKAVKNLESKKKSIASTLLQIFKNPQAWWLSLYSGLAFAPVMVFGGLWGISFTSAAFGLPSNVSAQAVSLIFIGFAIGAPVFGWFSDWLGKRRIVMFWGTVLALMTIIAIIYAPGISFSLLNFSFFFFGFCISSFLLCFTMIREITLSGIAATAIGFMNAFDALLGALSEPLTGKFLDMGWDGTIVNGARIFSVHDYKIAFITLPVFLVLSLLCLFRIKETHCKPVYPSQLP